MNMFRILDNATNSYGFRLITCHVSLLPEKKGTNRGENTMTQLKNAEEPT